MCLVFLHLAQTPLLACKAMYTQAGIPDASLPELVSSRLREIFSAVPIANHHSENALKLFKQPRCLSMNQLLLEGWVKLRFDKPYKRHWGNLRCHKLALAQQKIAVIDSFSCSDG